MSIRGCKQILAYLFITLAQDKQGAMRETAVTVLRHTPPLTVFRRVFGYIAYFIGTVEKSILVLVDVSFPSIFQFIEHTFRCFYPFACLYHSIIVSWVYIITIRAESTLSRTVGLAIAQSEWKCMSGMDAVSTISPSFSRQA